MKQEINRIMELISDTESIDSNDALSKIIHPNENNELSEMELDEVSAAAKPDYQKFLKRLEQTK